MEQPDISFFERGMKAIEDARQATSVTETYNDMIDKMEETDALPIFAMTSENKYMEESKQAIQTTDGRFGWYDKESGKGVLLPRVTYFDPWESIVPHGGVTYFRIVDDPVPIGTGINFIITGTADTTVTSENCPP